MPDFTISDNGPMSTIVMFRANSDEAKQWVDDKVEVPNYMWLGESFAADHRPARDLIEGILEAGFTVEHAVHSQALAR